MTAGFPFANRTIEQVVWCGEMAWPSLHRLLAMREIAKLKNGELPAWRKGSAA